MTAGGVPGCDCRLCRPGALVDDPERNCVAHVDGAGWEVLIVGPDGDAAPSFAYTIGLPHRAGHPELLISGMRTELMHHVLDDVAGAVLRGATVRPGDGVEGVLAGVPLLAEEVAPAALGHTVTWSSWFHRREVAAVQLVWPDTSARFAWQPGASARLDLAQPPEWRRPSARSGLFAPDPVWPLPVPPEARVLTCRHVVDGGEAVRFAVRESSDRGEDWTFHCGEDHGDFAGAVAVVHAAHVVRANPSLTRVAGLELEEAAWRDDVWSPWQREGDRR